MWYFVEEYKKQRRARSCVSMGHFRLAASLTQAKLVALPASQRKKSDYSEYLSAVSIFNLDYYWAELQHSVLLLTDD